MKAYNDVKEMLRASRTIAILQIYMKEGRKEANKWGQKMAGITNIVDSLPLVIGPTTPCHPP